MHSSISPRSQNASFLSSCACDHSHKQLKEPVLKPKKHVISEPPRGSIRPVTHLRHCIEGQSLVQPSSRPCINLSCTASVSLLPKMCSCSTLQREIIWELV